MAMKIEEIWREMKAFLTAPRGSGQLGLFYWLILIILVAGIVYFVSLVIKKIKKAGGDKIK